MDGSWKATKPVTRRKMLSKRRSIHKTFMHLVIATNTDGNCKVAYKEVLWCWKKQKTKKQVKSQNKESHFSRGQTTDKQVKQRQTGEMTSGNSIQTFTASNIHNLVEIVFCVRGIFFCCCCFAFGSISRTAALQCRSLRTNLLFLPWVNY